MRHSVVFIVFLVFSHFCFAESLEQERIWKLSATKKSVYLQQGIFHHKSSSAETVQLKGIRNSYVADRGYERVVIDFDSEHVPQIYGHISKDKKMISIDFYQTELGSQKLEIQKSKFVSAMNAYNLEKGNVTIELLLKDLAGVDAFYLTAPGRLVIDLKK